MATRQNSSSGKPKSPRIQVVLSEELCQKLSDLATKESRTVSNMAKVLIQEGINDYDKLHNVSHQQSITNTEGFRSYLESQKPQRLKGPPKRFRFYKPSSNN